MKGPSRQLRLLGTGWLFHLRYQSRSVFEIVSALLFPILFASLAFFLYGHNARGDVLLYASIGAGLMGTWDTTLFGSGVAIQQQRWLGTLELLVASPVPLLTLIASITLATATVGVYSLVATLAWGTLIFHIPLAIAHPITFLAAILLTVLSLGMLGMILASTFVRLRNAYALCNLLTYPITMLTGLLFPVSLLPAWCLPLSWMLAPTWGAQAMRAAASGGDATTPLLVCSLLSVVYGLIGAYTVKLLETSALRNASLSLA